MILIIIAVGLFLFALERAVLDKIIQLCLQIYSHELFQLYLPWVTLFSSILVLLKLLTLVRRRKEGVLILALLVQIFLPDPYVERNVKVEQVEIKKSKKNWEMKKFVHVYLIKLDNTWS